ncbi:MAG: carboxypeptidase-like regulatory domain-containing protein, partial [Bacteroidales bacterium]|nr:carboxypeptidase-like regulatory domain-containing protein [Bacteroidales bacterium]
MINKYIKSLLSLLFLLLSSTVLAQIRGVVTDSLTNERLMYISVYYEDKGIGVTTNENGEYLIRTQSGWDELTFSAVGYKKKVIKIDSRKKTVNVKLVPDDILLAEVVVKPKKERYSRKNNPAVDFMRKVIENKKYLKLEENDFYSFDKYQKMKTSLSNITEEKLKKGIYKRFAFLKDQMEPSVLTDSTYILPLSVQETASSTIYRKEPESEKEIIRGFNSSGIEEFFSTGDMLSTVLTNVFADINIYDDDIRLLQRRFVSPIGRNAISFYKFYLMDTIQVGQDECVHLTFVPQNSMDFGFTGHLYVLKDSTYAVKKCTMNLPKKTGVNFVESMDIIQEFQQLEDGNWVLTDDDMIVELKLIKSIEGVEVQRTTKYTNYSFETIGEHFFNIRGDVIKQADMMNQNEEFWSDVRQVPLTETESNMDLFINHLESIPGFKVIIFGAKALIENFVEIGNPSKFDIGPINTIMTSNYLEGFRMRLSGKTTAAFNPHWFLEGYGAYGFKDKRWKYFGEVTYSFKKSDFFPWEFPKHYLSLSYKNDVMAPMDKYLMTDKDNVFVSFKVSPVEHMSYVRDATLTYEKETHSGFSVKATAKHRQDKPAGKLEYLKNNEEKTPITKMNTTEFGVSLSYSPGQTYINTKQRRRPVTLDAPVFKLSHTMGVKGLGGDYKFNLTEASIWKRFW